MGGPEGGAALRRATTTRASRPPGEPALAGRGDPRRRRVLFSTPEYNHSIPGALKNALDWISRPLAQSPLRGKPVAVVGASTGLFGAVWAQAEVRKVLGAIGARVVDRELPVGQAARRSTSRAGSPTRPRAGARRPPGRAERRGPRAYDGRLSRKFRGIARCSSMQRAIALLAGNPRPLLAAPAGAAIQSDNVSLLGSCRTPRARSARASRPTATRCT